MAKRLLIVDDDEEHRIICHHIFSRRGWEIHGMEDAVHLMDVVGQLKPSVIIMDFHLPTVNGDTAIRKLKFHHDYRKIPIVFFSVHDDLPKLAKETGAEAYVQKPCSVQELIRTVEQLHIFGKINVT